MPKQCRAAIKQPMDVPGMWAAHVMQGPPAPLAKPPPPAPLPPFRAVSVKRDLLLFQGNVMHLQDASARLPAWCITRASPGQYQCITCALPWHYQGITRAVPVHYLCITMALPVHYLCITSALPAHHLCIINNHTLFSKSDLHDSS